MVLIIVGGVGIYCTNQCGGDVGIAYIVLIDHDNY